MYWEHLNAESLTEGKVNEHLTIYNKLHNCPKSMQTIHQYWLKFSNLPFNIEEMEKEEKEKEAKKKEKREKKRKGKEKKKKKDEEKKENDHCQ